MGGRSRRNDARGGLVGGAILVAIGAHLLLREIFDLDLGRYGWPILIFGPGLLLFLGMALGGRGAGGFAIPASILTTIGLMLFVQNATGRFETWAYSWALIPAAVGAGMLIAGRWDGNERQVREGQGTLRVGVLLFLGFGAWFELVIFRGGVAAPYALPVALIVVGAALLARNALRWRRAPEPIVADATEPLAQGTWPL